MHVSQTQNDKQNIGLNQI